MWCNCGGPEASAGSLVIHTDLVRSALRMTNAYLLIFSYRYLEGARQHPLAQVP